MLRILYFYDHQISITKHFSKILVILYGKRYLKYFRYGQDMHGYNKSPPPLLESFASNQPFIFKNQQNIKQWDKRNILWEIEMKEKNSWVAKKIFQNLLFFWYPFII